MVALPLLVLVIALIFGVPIAVALAGSGMLGIYLVTGDASKVMGILSLTPFSTVADYALTTIPMFILMAFFSASSGLARDLYTAASNWCSHIKGGLAIATVFACGIFGAMSGAGIATQTSIGKLLIAGIVPGIIAGILLALMVYLWVVISPKHAPSTYRVGAKERWASLVRIWPSLLLILLVLVLLYTGIATPTEVGALGALLAGVIGAVFGRLTFADAIDAVKSTIRTSAMIFLILLGATIFGYYMALSRIPQEVVTAVIAMELNRWVVIIGIVVAYFVISMFMDEIPLLLLTLQLTFPLITSLGFAPIWFGVISMMMVAMGLVFPPVGLIAFIVSATAGVDLMKVYKGTSVLMLSIVATTVLLMIFPQIALWLPATMR